MTSRGVGDGDCAIQEELQIELEQEMASYGIDPTAQGLTDDQYADAMAELGRRRGVLLASKDPKERRRIHAMRNNMLWHLQNVSLGSLDHTSHDASVGYAVIMYRN